MPKSKYRKGNIIFQGVRSRHHAPRKHLTPWALRRTDQKEARQS